MSHAAWKITNHVSTSAVPRHLETRQKQFETNFAKGIKGPTAPFLYCQQEETEGLVKARTDELQAAWVAKNPGASLTAINKRRATFQNEATHQLFNALSDEDKAVWVEKADPTIT